MSSEDHRIAIVLFGHGSAVEEANQGIQDLAERIQAVGRYSYVRAAFLGPGRPELGAAIAEAVKAGYQRIVVLPYFLTIGIHLRRDLPKPLAAERQKHPQVKIQVGRSLEDHPEMALLILGRIREVTDDTKAEL
jgi:sirohydrochlorin ferrochelatase